MGDLETLLQDFSYLKSLEYKDVAPTKASKKLWLPDPSVQHTVEWHFARRGGPKLRKLLREPIGRKNFEAFVLDDAYPDKTAQQGFRFKRRVSQLVSEPATIALEQAQEIQATYIDDPVMQKLWEGRSDLAARLAEDIAQLFQAVEIAPPPPDVQETDSANASEREQIPANGSFLSCKSMFQPYVNLVMEYLGQEPWEAFRASAHWTRYCQWKHLEANMQVSERDFDVHRILGRGGFGEVYGCRKHDTGAMFAMKKLEKKRLKLKHQESTAVHERNVLSQMNSKFVTNLKYAFQNNESLFLILELMEGGDLSWHLKQRRAFTDWQAKFYAAQIVMGLAHIHSRDLLFRDLKPANVLLDGAGNARISDLGLVRDISKSLPSSECGTHGFMAPEVLTPDLKYSLPADWWSLGCCIFQFLTGSPPHCRGERPKKNELIRRCLEQDVDIPSSLSPQARDLLAALLQRDPKDRLGTERGAKEVREHPWFQEIDWHALVDHKIPPPIKPNHGRVNAKDVIDIDTFNYKETKKIKITDQDNQKYYAHFEHVMSQQWQSEVMVVYDLVTKKSNQIEKKKMASVHSGATEPAATDCLMQGILHQRKKGLFGSSWGHFYCVVYADRLELLPERQRPCKSSILLADIPDIIVDEEEQTFQIQLREGKPITLRAEHASDFACWHDVIARAWATSIGKQDRIPAQGLSHLNSVSSMAGDTLPEAEASAAGSDLDTITEHS
eukprot:m.163707 g.163707  ORF g.163707 m.163707 type:complete len:727 (+) comp17696_c6_seq1:553-2733(+)